MSWKRRITVMAMSAPVIVVASVAPLVTPSLSSAVQGQGWFWCSFDGEEWEHRDFLASIDPEELPAGPNYKAIPPTDKHADDVPIGSLCLIGPAWESHTEYND